MSERLSCPREGCFSSEFWILPGGSICCADEDCHARVWIAGRVSIEGTDMARVTLRLNENQERS